MLETRFRSAWGRTSPERRWNTTPDVALPLYSTSPGAAGGVAIRRQIVVALGMSGSRGREREAFRDMHRGFVRARAVTATNRIAVSTAASIRR
jgi:hypothetical protein